MYCIQTHRRVISITVKSILKRRQYRIFGGEKVFKQYASKIPTLIPPRPIMTPLVKNGKLFMAAEAEKPFSDREIAQKAKIAMIEQENSTFLVL